jgi:hypothetical protein
MTKQPFTIAADIGSGFSKYILLPEGGKSAQELVNHVKTFKTAVGPSRAVTLQPGVQPLIVDFEDKSFYVSKTAETGLDLGHRTNTLSPNWAFEDGYKALVYFILARALTSAGVVPSDTPIPVRFITGLPQAYYEVGAEKMRNLYSGAHRFRFGGQQWVVDLVDVEVVPQAMGAYYAALETCLSEAESKERVGVIDIGTFTSDFCLSEDVVYHAYESGGVNIGVSRLVDGLGAVMERDFGLRFSEEALKKAFERGQVLVRAGMVDVRKQIEEVTTQAGKQLQKSLPTGWDTSTMYLILAGGGGQNFFFGDFMKREYPHIKQVPHPENAIVLGYAIYGAALDAE